MTDDPQSTTAWAQGAAGEQRVGNLLDRLTMTGAIVLHDRRLPRTRANIDHIVVAESGVWVVDSKRYQGEVSRRNVGGLFRSDERLYVGAHDRTKLVAGMIKQVDAVQDAVMLGVPTHAVLCFTGSRWSRLARPFELDGVLVTWPAALVKRIAAATSRQVRVEDVARRIAAQLPPAKRPS